MMKKEDVIDRITNKFNGRNIRHWKFKHVLKTYIYTLFNNILGLKLLGIIHK